VTVAASELASVRFAVFDFDGVFTDNRVWTNERGEESVACWRGDAYGLRRLEEVGVEHLVISTEVNEAVGARARKIRATCLQAVEDKLPVLEEEVARRGLRLEDTSFLGNDVNDAGCLGAVGLPVVPADAWPEVVPLARLVLTRSGGRGCVRELCDAIWSAKREAR
jgi:YrbI family 3-deoxy-D-manno-octulosonate 8-phosphate phosphatase